MCNLSETNYVLPTQNQFNIYNTNIKASAVHCVIHSQRTVEDKGRKWPQFGHKSILYCIVWYGKGFPRRYRDSTDPGGYQFGYFLPKLRGHRGYLRPLDTTVRYGSMAQRTAFYKVTYPRQASLYFDLIICSVFTFSCRRRLLLLLLLPWFPIQHYTLSLR